MSNPINTGTSQVPLELAKTISKSAGELWESGEFLEKVTPTTASLLKFWFSESYTDNRFLNFHYGQKEAILNTIYLHEILKTSSVLEVYEKCDMKLLQKLDLEMLAKEKYRIPKYAIKMATGTGKTWVMNAIFIWQYLNAKEERRRGIDSKRYSSNFLLVAPGVIVYDRLLDSYFGKERPDGSRDVETSDIFKNKELFLPPQYIQTIKAFLQSSVVKKDEIGRKITSDGMIAITNWHLLMGKEETMDDENPLNDPSCVIADIFPASPGVSSGNSLESLDNAYFSGGEIDFLANLEDLVVMNDEAHHIHENKTAGEVQEVEWQKSLNLIAKNKGTSFVQIDFSATPYDTTGSGQKRAKHFFPHIIVDFDLTTAIKLGLVKMIAIDKRSELASLELDYKAIRDGDDNKGKVVALSDGQKIMIQAGLAKLEILENQFVKHDKTKYPKMLIMCEDTSVVPFVEDFLKTLDVKNEEMMSVHSDKKGDMKASEWSELKQKLFNVDKLENPKVIISVLMLREGFDVSNICVIVPLRSSKAMILLEQTIGRGLRLMWREREYADIKQENLENVLVLKKEPNNYLDVLSIIEHPEFEKFYEDLNSIPFTIDGGSKKSAIGDMLSVGLKENFENYDLYFPEILNDEEEELVEPNLNINELNSYNYHSLSQLKSWIAKGEIFHSQELTVKTNFGEYTISADLFKAENYNEYLAKLLTEITSTLGRTKAQGHSRKLPLMQINQPKLIGVIDIFIRTKLFSETFNPFADENWRILMLKGANLTQHIIKEISRAVYNMQTSTVTNKAIINKIYFSSISQLKMREKYALDLQKTIYEKTAYPTNNGGFEKSFLEFLDSDSKVIKFIKINEHNHLFARVFYFRDDGLMGWYSPDFMVETADKILIIETKADTNLKNANVQQKQRATLDFIRRINSLDENLRSYKTWEYLLLGETQFYSLKKSGADIKDIINSAKPNEYTLKTSLF